MEEDSMKVTFDGSKCQRSGKCRGGLPEVFYVDDDNLVIDTDKASEEEVRAVVSQCPSGALQCVDD
jgi:uncharacterized Fe-S cluster protein YjdI